MITKTTVVALFALSLLAFTGIGYAAFTTTTSINVTATAGTVGPLDWSAGAAAPSTSYGVCTVGGGGGGGAPMTITMSALAPGDSCTVTATLTNTGNIPASLSDALTSCNDYGSGLCSYLGYTDNLAGGYLSAGGSWTGFSATITLSSGTPTGYQGYSAVFTITVTGSSP